MIWKPVTVEYDSMLNSGLQASTLANNSIADNSDTVGQIVDEAASIVIKQNIVPYVIGRF